MAERGKSFLLRGLEPSLSEGSPVLRYRIRTDEASDIRVFGLRLGDLARIRFPRRTPEPQFRGPSVAAIRREFRDYFATVMGAHSLNRLILIIDGLDELSPAERGTPEITACLPEASSLPNGLVVVLGTRSALRATVVADVKRLGVDRIAMNRGDPNYRDALRRFLLVRYPKLPQELHDPIFAAADWRWLWVDHLAIALSAGAFNTTDTLPASVEFYPAYLSRIEERTGREVFAAVYRPLLALLTVVPEAVETETLASWGLRGDAMIMALPELGGFLLSEASSNGRRRYRVAHESFRAWVQSEPAWQEELATAHRRPVRWILSQCPDQGGLDATDVTVRAAVLHLATHLAGTGEPPDVPELKRLFRALHCTNYTEPREAAAMQTAAVAYLTWAVEAGQDGLIGDLCGARIDLGISLRESGRLYESEAELQAVIKVGDDSGDERRAARLQLAHTEYALHKFDAAVAEIEAVLAEYEKMRLAGRASPRHRGEELIVRAYACSYLSAADRELDALTAIERTISDLDADADADVDDREQFTAILCAKHAMQLADVHVTTPETVTRLEQSIMTLRASNTAVWRERALECELFLAKALSSLGHGDEALRLLYRLAIDFQELVDAGDQKHLRMLANVRQVRAALMLEHGFSEDADLQSLLDLLRDAAAEQGRAVTSWEKLANDHPSATATRRQQAQHLHLLLRSLTGQVEASSVQMSITAPIRLRALPHDLAPRLQRAVDCEARGDAQGSLDALTPLVVECEERARNNQSLRLDVFALRTRQAILLGQLNRPREALREWRACVDGLSAATTNSSELVDHYNLACARLGLASALKPRSKKAIKELATGITELESLRSRGVWVEEQLAVALAYRAELQSARGKRDAAQESRKQGQVVLFTARVKRVWYQTLGFPTPASEFLSLVPLGEHSVFTNDAVKERLANLFERIQAVLVADCELTRIRKAYLSGALSAEQALLAGLGPLRLAMSKALEATGGQLGEQSTRALAELEAELQHFIG